MLPTPDELSDAWYFLVSLEQCKLDINKNLGLVPTTKLIKLRIIEKEVTLYIVGGRAKQFPESFHEQHLVPIIPYGQFGYLVVKH